MRTPRSLAVLSLVFVALGCASAPPPRPTCPTLPWPTELDHVSTEETRQAAADDYFEAAQSGRTFTSAIEVTLQHQLSANPNLRAVETPMREFFSRYMSFESIRPQLRALYLQTFSELELRQMAAFQRTPAGRRAVQEIPDLQRRGGEIGAAAVRAHQTELEAMLREYLERHPVGR